MARDPEGRRQALADAVVEVVAEVGVGRVTHRAVAARAGVPLGATTYYFPTLADLVAHGMAELGRRGAADVAGWAEAIRAADDLPGVLTRLVTGYLADRDRARLEYELYLAAARDPALRPPAVAWVEGTREVLGPAVAALVDGVLLQALVTGEDVDAGAFAAAVRALS